MILHDPTSEPWADSHFRCTKCGKIKITRRKGYPSKYRDYGLCKNCSGYPWGIIHGVEFRFSIIWETVAEHFKRIKEGMNQK